MRILITVMGGLCLLAALYVAIANWGCAIITERNKRKGIDRYHSTVPVVSILLAFCAMFMWPYWPHAWVMLISILDFANLMLLLSPVWLLLHFIRKHRLDRKGPT